MVVTPAFIDLTSNIHSKSRNFPAATSICESQLRHHVCPIVCALHHEATLAKALGNPDGGMVQECCGIQEVGIEVGVQSKAFNRRKSRQ